MQRKYYILIFTILTLVSVIMFIYKDSKYLFYWRDIVKYWLINDTKAITSILEQKNIKNYNVFYGELSKNNNNSINISVLLLNLTWKNLSNWIKDNFILSWYNKNCFYFRINVKEFKWKEKYLANYFKKDNFDSCNLIKWDTCYMFFTEKWLLNKDDIYKCDGY